MDLNLQSSCLSLPSVQVCVQGFKCAPPSPARVLILQVPQRMENLKCPPATPYNPMSWFQYVAGIKYIDKNQPRVGGVILAHNSRLQSILVGRLSQWDSDVTSAVMDTCMPTSTAHFLYFIQPRTHTWGVTIPG